MSLRPGEGLINAEPRLSSRQRVLRAGLPLQEQIQDRRCSGLSWKPQRKRRRGGGWTQPAPLASVSLEAISLGLGLPGAISLGLGLPGAISRGRSAGQEGFRRLQERRGGSGAGELPAHTCLSPQSCSRSPHRARLPLQVPRGHHVPGPPGLLLPREA